MKKVLFILIATMALMPGLARAEDHKDAAKEDQHKMMMEDCMKKCEKMKPEDCMKNCDHMMKEDSDSDLEHHETPLE